MLLKILVVGAGGFIGSVARYLISLIKITEPFSFPIKTLTINVLGSFVIGLVVACALKNCSLDEKLILFIKVGICGGFTTFSTFALETMDLFQSGNYIVAISYIILSVLLSILAVFGSGQLIYK